MISIAVDYMRYSRMLMKQISRFTKVFVWITRTKYTFHKTGLEPAAYGLEVRRATIAPLVILTQTLPGIRNQNLSKSRKKGYIAQQVHSGFLLVPEI